MQHASWSGVECLAGGNEHFHDQSFITITNIILWHHKQEHRLGMTVVECYIIIKWQIEEEWMPLLIVVVMSRNSVPILETSRGTLLDRSVELLDLGFCSKSDPMLMGNSFDDDDDNGNHNNGTCFSQLQPIDF